MKTLRPYVGLWGIALRLRNAGYREDSQRKFGTEQRMDRIILPVVKLCLSNVDFRWSLLACRVYCGDPNWKPYNSLTRSSNCAPLISSQFGETGSLMPVTLRTLHWTETEPAAVKGVHIEMSPCTLQNQYISSFDGAQFKRTQIVQ
jgi:hypothetical protein